MRYYFLLLASILFTVTAIDCKAQNAKVDTSFHPHWEIGVDLLPLIDKENAPKNSLFARRNYFHQNGKGRAWRMRAGAEVEVRDFSDVAHWTPSTFRTYAPYLSIGHEWQRVSNKFRWFFGIDGGVSYSRRNDFYLSTFVLTDSLREKIVVNEWRFAINGVLGFQVKISNNLSLGSEASLIASYRSYHFKNDSYYRGILATGNKSEDFDDVFNLKLNPIYVINLIYSIKSKRHENRKT